MSAREGAAVVVTDIGTEVPMLTYKTATAADLAETVLDPEVIANAALYLDADLAAAVRGISLPVDAGHLLIPGHNLDPVR